MYLSGWLAAFVSILLLGLTGAGPAVTLLEIGPIFLLLYIRSELVRPTGSASPAPPKSVDIEAIRIRGFQQSLDERGMQRDH